MPSRQEFTLSKDEEAGRGESIQRRRYIPASYWRQHQGIPGQGVLPDAIQKELGSRNAATEDDLYDEKTPRFGSIAKIHHDFFLLGITDAAVEM